MKFPLVLFGLMSLAQRPTVEQAEARLVRNGYSETLDGAYWAAEKGPSIVPVLEHLLAKKSQYQKELRGATGAFPFNVYWALAHIPSAQALLVLQRQTDPEDRILCRLAIKGFELRKRKKASSFGVVGDSCPLLATASMKSKLMANLPAGTEVRILKERVANLKELGARGGPAVYDQVLVLSTRARGFIPRKGDDFSPFF